jgi:hypothetical protein
MAPNMQSWFLKEAHMQTHSPKYVFNEIINHILLIVGH